MTTPDELLIEQLEAQVRVARETILDVGVVMDHRLQTMAEMFDEQDRKLRRIADLANDAADASNTLSSETKTIIVKLYEEVKKDRQEALKGLKAIQADIEASPYMKDRNAILAKEAEKAAKARQEAISAVKAKLDAVIWEDYREGALISAKSIAFQDTPAGEKPGWAAIHSALVLKVLPQLVVNLGLEELEGDNTVSQYVLKLAKEWDTPRSKSKTR